MTRYTSTTAGLVLLILSAEENFGFDNAPESSILDYLLDAPIEIEVEFHPKLVSDSSHPKPTESVV